MRRPRCAGPVSAPEAFTNAPSTTRIPSVIVEVFKTFGCAVVPIPLPTAQRRLIRRVRRAPHLSANQVRQFFARFQLDLQTGTGLRRGRAPIRSSVYAGRITAGIPGANEHLVEAGKIGQYARRAIFRRLGTGRDRVFEISVSDPVAWRILDAYLDVELGSG